MLIACENCLKVHGASENDEYVDPSLISSASASFCTGTPVTDFEDLFSAQLETALTGTATGTDLFPSETAVSLYYTGSIETNAGEITGSATLAVFSSGISGTSFPEGTSTGESSASITFAPSSGQTTVSTSTRAGSFSITSVSSSTSGSESKASSTNSPFSTAKTTGSAASDGKVVSGTLQGLAAVVVGIICMV